MSEFAVSAAIGGARRPALRSLAMAIGLAACLAAGPAWAQGKAAKALAQPRSDASSRPLAWTSFAKERELLDEPYVIASPEAQVLWDHVIRHIQGTSDVFKEMLLQGGSYVKLAGGCYLIDAAAIHFTCLDRPRVDALTPWSAPGNTDVLEVHRLPGSDWWALVQTGDLSHGVVSDSYHALIATGGRRPLVVGQPLASSASTSEGDGADQATLCPQGEAGPTMPVASRILSHQVRGEARGSFRVSFPMLVEDCKSSRQRRRTQVFRVTASGARKLP